ncbi:ATP-dependent DNA helicase RecG [uncultured Bifidobacterium sp.]|uniref:ATP-dependent DNA helicase RecG n=1 Tax=uncultured Bifidobacterium sp. TaxID=165187 RepID=UPI0028DBE75D|nr:ATP-dependent DNA helicase RecG [uncultured Bifidobacterium sp.]
MDALLSSLVANRRRVSALSSLGVSTVRDALTYYPFRVADPLPVRTLSQAVPGESMAAVVAVVDSRIQSMAGRHGWRLEVRVEDAGTDGRPGGAQATLVFFSGKRPYIAWMSGRLAVGAEVVVSGIAGEFSGALQFVHPDVVPVAGPSDAPAALARAGRPRPVYHASSRISGEHVHDVILALIDAVTPDAVPDVIPEDVREKRGLPHRLDALRAVHDPDSVEKFRSGIAALRYEEALVSQTAVLRERMRSRGEGCFVCADRTMAERFVGALPFTLTDGQRRVIADIAEDMAGDHPMHRLLQGEVGSGKTVVALTGMLQAVGSGQQAVLVAPTQVLARQHADTLTSMIADAGLEVPVLLLTGGMRLAVRRRLLARVASGEPVIVVATHAVFSRTFQAPGLALAVIDEQHRFGVEQRGSLGAGAAGVPGPDGRIRRPHLLVMTATPIPRTAAMTWFGDLDVSELTELPGGRRPIRTVVVGEEDSRTMAAMFAHLRRRIDAGERAFVVCPRIEEDDDASGAADEGFDEVDVADVPDGETAEGQAGTPERPALHAVSEMARRLAGLPQFQGIRIATLTGRDSDEDKRRVMEGFVSGDTPLLVATTVIEVGIDVPTASCIVIFDADRYGLSQLHQLRGRVGRGGTASWAFLVSRAERGDLADRRLAVVAGTLDGAEIARADLELRGAGDVLGDAQSGMHSRLKLLRVVTDADLIGEARADAERVLDADPELVGNVQLAGAVLDLTRSDEKAILGG